MIRFIEERKNNWERLEDLLSILDAASLRGLSKMANSANSIVAPLLI
jgi:hypothetical protein